MWALEGENIDTPGGVVARQPGRAVAACVRAVAGPWRAQARGGAIIPACACGRSGGRVRAVATCRRTAVCAPPFAPPGVRARAEA